MGNTLATYSHTKPVIHALEFPASGQSKWEIQDLAGTTLLVLNFADTLLRDFSETVFRGVVFSRLIRKM